MSASESDWRLTGQEEYLKGITLRRRAWAPESPLNDHDHCEFCWAKFPHEVSEGYGDEGGCHWVCDQCFADFREMFEWQLGS